MFPSKTTSMVERIFQQTHVKLLYTPHGKYQCFTSRYGSHKSFSVVNLEHPRFLTLTGPRDAEMHEESTELETALKLLREVIIVK